MAGSIVISISPHNVWSIGTHGFVPIMERIRAGYPSAVEGEDADIFSSIDDGFDMIGVENLSQSGFMKFVCITEQQLVEFSADHSVDENWRSVLTKSWRDLLDKLHQDLRYVTR